LASGTPFLRFTDADSDRANKEWKATCGPHAIAAACSVTLDAVYQAISKAEINYRGWMSPTQVTKTLAALDQPYNLRTGLKTMDLCEGINRVQWEGPWLNPGVPSRVAYFQTHLVAHFSGWVLCTCCLPTKWISAAEWRRFHLEVEPRSPFHITHHWTVGLGT
jgi:hypothetical protein